MKRIIAVVVFAGVVAAGLATGVHAAHAKANGLAPANGLVVQQGGPENEL